MCGGDRRVPEGERTAAADLSYLTPRARAVAALGAGCGLRAVLLAAAPLAAAWALRAPRAAGLARGRLALAAAALAAPRAGFAGPAAGAAAAATPDAGCASALPRRKRPKRPPRSGAAASIALHSSSVRLFGSRSFGTLAFFFLSVTYGP